MALSELQSLINSASACKIRDVTHLLLKEKEMHSGVVLKGENEETFVLEMPHILYYGFTVDAFFSIQRVHNSYLDVRQKSEPLNKAQEQIIKDFNFGVTLLFCMVHYR